MKLNKPFIDIVDSTRSGSHYLFAEGNNTRNQCRMGDENYSKLELNVSEILIRREVIMSKETVVMSGGRGGYVQGEGVGM